VVAVPLNPVVGRDIVIAYDGSLQAARAVQAFQATGLGVGRPVHVVHIGNGSGAGSPHACRSVEFLITHGITASFHNVRAADSVAHELVGACRELRAGLVVTGVYGRSTQCEFFLGSVTRAMLAESQIPLLLYH
jgi:nucleotide-binding universal stress UspA family protein